jgi:hypothetical protein
MMDLYHLVAELRWPEWHWLDVTLGVVLAVVVINSTRRGFVREGATLVGLAIGMAIGDRFTVPVADLIASYTGRLPLMDELAKVVIIIWCIAGAGLAASLLRSTLQLPGFGVTDRVGGLALGVAEGSTILGMALAFSVRLGLAGLDPGGFDGSTLAPILLRWWITVAQMATAQFGFPLAV